MKAVILAAGSGKRLLPIDIPKPLLKINSDTIIEAILKNLEVCGIPSEDIIIVVGYKSNEIIKLLEKKGLYTFIVNSKFSETNNLYSLWLVIKDMQDDFICLNADISFDVKILKELIEIHEDFCIVTADSKYGDTLVTTQNGLVKNISKNIEGKKEFVGISKFSIKGCKIFFNILKQISSKQRMELWVHDGIQKIIDTGSNVHEYYIKNKFWVEIDSIDDLRCHKQMENK